MTEHTLNRRTVLRGSLALSAGSVATVLAACTPEAQSTADPESASLSPLSDLPEPVVATLEQSMQAAVAQAASAEWKFGAVLVNTTSGDIVARAANDTGSGDPSMHAEVHVLRKAGLAGVDLSTTVLVTTAESCPMCASCAVWGHIAGVAYGTPISYLSDRGFEQIHISQPDVVSAGFVPMPVVGNQFRDLTDPLYEPGPAT